jgi:hypothetical protein
MSGQYDWCSNMALAELRVQIHVHMSWQKLEKKLCLLPCKHMFEQVDFYEAPVCSCLDIWTSREHLCTNACASV